MFLWRYGHVRLESTAVAHILFMYLLQILVLQERQTIALHTKRGCAVEGDERFDQDPVIADWIFEIVYASYSTTIIRIKLFEPARGIDYKPLNIF